MSKTYYTGFFPSEDGAGVKGSAAFPTYTAQLSIYKRADIAPATPTGGSYNFVGGVFTPPTGWSVSVPAGIEVVWVSNVKLTTYDARELVDPIEGWSAPVAAFQTGVSPVDVTLTNPTVNVPADIDGGSLNLNNSGTDIYVYQGTAQLVFDPSLSTVGSWNVTKENSASITGGTVSDQGTFARYSNITGMSENTGTITFTITVRTTESGPLSTYTATQTFKKLLGAVVDTTPPAVPTGLTPTSSVTTLDGGNTIGKLTVTWAANTESDFRYYEVEIKEGEGSYIGYQTSTNSYEWTVKTNTSYSVRVRSVDRSANRSAWSTISTSTTVKDTTVPSVPTGLIVTASIRNVFLSWTNSSATDIKFVEVWENTVNNSATATKIATLNAEPGQKGGFTRSGIVTGTTYYYWLKSVDSSGNTSAFSTVASTTPVAVGNTDITAGTINADRIQAGTITGDRFDTGTSLPGTITVGSTGVSIGTVQSQAADPASVVNLGATTISPGKVSIFGSTTLNNWKNGPDSTQINGGAIAANTITANKLYVGLRGVDMAGIQFQANWNGTNLATNSVYWSDGYIIYTNDSGVVTTVDITSNSETWSSGILYIYWVKGETIFRTTPLSTTAYSPNNIVLATYRGGTDLIVNYGRTIIDGSQITTGTVTADRIRADSVITNRFYVGNSGMFIHGSYYGTNLGSIVVNDGTRDRVTLGYTSASTIGLKIVDAAGSTILDSSTTASQILNSSVTFSGLSDKPTSLSNINATEGTKLTGIATGATKNTIFRQATAPTGAVGDIWVDTSVTPNETKTWSGTSWVVSSTVGAKAGANLVDSSGASLSDSAIKNTAISIASNGALSGAGGGQVTIGGLGYTGDLNATSGGGLIPNSSSFSSGWTIGANVTLTTGGPGDPAPKYLRSTSVAGTANSAIIDIPASATKLWFYYQSRSNLGTPASGFITGNIYYYRADGTFLSAVTINTNYPNTSTWNGTYFLQQFTIPTGAAKLQMYVSLQPTTGNWIDVALPNIFTIEPGATVGAPSGTLVAGVAASDVATATTNFNSSNDRNSAAVIAPTIATDGTAIDHALQNNGSADISFEWAWGGSEGDIDGFLVYVYQSSSATAYTFGTTPAAETVYTIPANKRAFILYGVTPDLYYSFAVQAYRSVDKDINSSGAIKSTLVKATGSGENPYRPSTTVAFAGDVTGTVNGIAAANINVWSQISGTGKPADNATKNTIFRQATAPTGGTYTTGDLWIDTDSSPIAVYNWNGSSWVVTANNTTNTNQLTDGAGLGTTATWSGVSGTGKPADNATKNTIFRQATAPTGGTYTTGDLWIDTDSSPIAVYNWNGSSWVVTANNTTNTNQLTDGAGLGTTAIWNSVSGTGKPQDNATVGATFGVNVNGQITAATASTYIANAAIGAAQIGSIQLVGTNNFSVKSAATGARMEMDSKVIKIFDSSGILRVKLGDLSA